jgi:hypothetical protein
VEVGAFFESVDDWSFWIGLEGSVLKDCRCSIEGLSLQSISFVA